MEIKLLYIIIASIPLVIFSLLRPKLAFYSFLVLRPIIDNISALRTVNIIEGINLLKIIGMLFPFILLMSLFFSKVNFLKNRLANIYLLFILASTPSIFLSVSWINAGGYLLQLFTFWVVFIYVLHLIKEEKDIKYLFLVILCASFFPILRFIITFYTGETIEVEKNLLRSVGGYFHMAPISGILFLFIPAYLFFIARPTSITRKILLLIGLFFLIICIYKTYYRSALLGTLILFVSYLSLRKNFTILVLIGSVLAILFIFSPFLQGRFSPLIDTLNNFNLLFDPIDNSYDYLLSGRFGVWRKMTTMYLYNCQPQNLFFGFGVHAIIDKIQIAPHNDYWSALFQHGPISLILFIIFLLSSLQLSIHGLPHIVSKIILSLLVGSIILALAENFFVSVRNLLYIGTYIGILVKSIELQETKQFHPDSRPLARDTQQ